jgi:hypothetical protein
VKLRVHCPDQDWQPLADAVADRYLAELARNRHVQDLIGRGFGTCIFVAIIALAIARRLQLAAVLEGGEAIAASGWRPVTGHYWLRLGNVVLDAPAPALIVCAPPEADFPPARPCRFIPIRRRRAHAADMVAAKVLTRSPLIAEIAQETAA